MWLFIHLLLPSLLSERLHFLSLPGSLLPQTLLIFRRAPAWIIVHAHRLASLAPGATAYYCCCATYYSAGGRTSILYFVLRDPSITRSLFLQKLCASTNKSLGLTPSLRFLDKINYRMNTSRIDAKPHTRTQRAWTWQFHIDCFNTCCCCCCCCCCRRCLKHAEMFRIQLVVVVILWKLDL